MKRHLPPLNALRAFEAAARLESISAAADELSVTPAAVSHQVRALEEFFQLALFHRSVRKIKLTARGERLLPLLTQGFDTLVEACERIRTEEESGLLTVSTTSSFAVRWLVQALEDFHARHPNITVRLDGSYQLTDFERDEVDIAIRFGTGPYPDLHAVPLFEEKTYVLASPTLATPEKPLDRPEDLRHHTLIHMSWKSPSGLVPDWPMWFRTVGVDGVDTDKGPVFSNTDIAVEAAVNGQGVMLSGAVHAKSEIAKGRLIALFGLEMPTDFHYWLVCPKAHANRPKVAAFREWIVAAMSEVT